MMAPPKIAATSVNQPAANLKPDVNVLGAFCGCKSCGGGGSGGGFGLCTLLSYIFCTFSTISSVEYLTFKN